MSLSEKELLLLDCFMYSDIAPNSTGKELKDVLEQFVDPNTGKVTSEMLKKFNIGSGENIKFSGDMNATNMADVMNQMLDSNSLMKLKITHTTAEYEGSIRAACFYDSETGKATVAFRGTGGSFKQWYNNFEGYGEITTETQEDAVDFINSLPFNKIDVTGHSNGGGQAMYVTVMCGEKIERCVSFEGQGVSDDFIAQNADKIAENKDKIKNISAYNDPVNALLYALAGEIVYVKSNENIFSHGGYTILTANIFDENGNFSNDSIVEQSWLCKRINELTMTLDLFSDIPVVGSLMEYNIDFIGIVVGLIIGKNYKELDNWYRAFEIWVSSAIELITGLSIEDLTAAFNNLVNLIATVYSEISDWYNRTFNIGYKYATANPTILVDTYKLCSYATRLNSVNRRVSSLDSRLNSLYRRVCDFEDLISTANALWNLLQADTLTSYSLRLKKCSSYLEETANDFEKAEKNIVNKAI